MGDEPGSRRRALLLVNSAARRGTKGVDEAIGVLGDRFELVDHGDTDPGELAEVIRSYRGRADLVVLGGGDGTMSAALPALLDLDIPLGVLPVGTANNLARTLDLPKGVRDAAEIIVGGRTRRIDVGRVNDRFFLTTASLGLSVRITEDLTAASKRRWGPLAYGLTAIRSLARATPFKAEIRFAGQVLEPYAVQVVVGNGRYYGSALTVAEHARIDDGRLDLYVIESQPRWRLLLLVPALKKGSHAEKEKVVAASSRTFEITTAVPRDIDVDGELATQTPARFSVLPHVLEIFVPGNSK